MNVAELQIRLHEAIDSIGDSAKLEAIYKLLEGSKGPFPPMTHEEYIKAIDEARQQIQEGDFQDVEDMERESDNW